MDEYIKKFNLQKDIFEKAKIINFLIREKNFKIKEIAKAFNLSSSYICHLKRILNLPEIIIDGYQSKLISISHLFLLSRIKDDKKLIKIYEKILAENLTTQQVEDLIREELYQIKNKGKYLSEKDKDILIYEFNKKFPEANLKIIQTRTYGKIFIKIKGNLEKTSKLIKKIISEIL